MKGGADWAPPFMLPLPFAFARPLGLGSASSPSSSGSVSSTLMRSAAWDSTASAQPSWEAQILSVP